MILLGAVSAVCAVGGASGRSPKKRPPERQLATEPWLFLPLSGGLGGEAV